MPPVFRFKIGPNVHWESQLESIQCEDKVASGARCKRKCVIGSPYCYTHLRAKHSLRIKASTIPNAGKGLFADAPGEDENAIVFARGEKIIGYFGEKINLQELNDRYGKYTAPYGFQVVKDRLYEDAALKRGVGSLANSKPTLKENNATIIIDQRRKVVSLRATKNIRNGQEIFCDYGDEYQFDDGSSYSTTAR